MADKVSTIPKTKFKKEASPAQVLNKTRLKSSQHQPRAQWLSYVVSFCRHRNSMLAAWMPIFFSLKHRLDTLTVPNESTIPTQDADYRHKKLCGNPLGTVGEVYAVAELVKVEFDAVMSAIAKENNFVEKIIDITAATETVKSNSVNGILVAVEMLKNKDTAIEKAKEVYHKKGGPAITWVNDIIRCSFVCYNDKAIVDVFNALQKRVKIIRLKNRFLNPTPGGYRDLLISAQLSSDSEIRKVLQNRGDNQQIIEDIISSCPLFIVEIQIHHWDMLQFANSRSSYRYYKYFRSFFGDAALDPKRLVGKLRCLKKMDQIGEDVSQLDKFIEDFLTAPGRASKDVERLQTLNDLFLLTKEYALMEKVQEFIIFHLRYKGVEGQSELAEALAAMSNIQIARGEYAKAQPLVQEALEISVKNFGECHLETAVHLNNMAGLLHCQYMLEDALVLYKQVLAIRTALLPPGHQSIMSCQVLVAETFDDLKMWAESREIYTELLDQFKTVYGVCSIEVIDMLDHIAMVDVCEGMLCC